MEENFDLELENIEKETEEKLKVKNRFQTLSEKVKLTAQERDEIQSKLKEESEARTNAEKERDFFKDFSTNVGKYPHASEYQDKIWEKVKGGYATEDAIISTLAREGKLNTGQEQTPQGDVAGGSAPNQIGDLRDKGVAEMTTEEKLAALMEAEKKGELST